MTTNLWDTVFEERTWGRWPNEGVVRALGRLRAMSSPEQIVLELGCGPGPQLRYLEEEGDRSIGIDLSSVALVQASDRLAALGLPRRLVQADIRVIPVRDGSLNVVIDVEATCCLTEDGRRASWAEVARVLQVGGAFVAVAFSTETEGLDDAPRLSPYTIASTDVGPFAGLGTLSLIDEDEARKIAENVGLQLVDHQRITRTVGPEHLRIEELVLVLQR